MVNEELMLQIADMVDSGIIVVCQNRITYQNLAAAEQLKQFDYIPNTEIDFFSRNISIPKRKIRSWQRAMAAGTLWQDKLEACINGKNAALVVKAKSTDGSYGKYGSYLITIESATVEEKNISPQIGIAETHSHIVDYAPFMFLQWNRNGQILYSNRTFERFLGLKANEVVGRSVQEFLPYSNSQQLELHIESIKRNGGYAVAENKVKSTDEERWAFWMNAQVQPTASTEQYFSVGIDISDRNIWDNEYNVLWQQYNTLVERLNYPLFILNRDMEVTFANDSAIQWFEAKGYRRIPNSNAFFNISIHPRASEYKEFFKKNIQSVKTLVFWDNDEIYERICFPLIQSNEVVSYLIEIRKVKGFKREHMLLDINGDLPLSIIETAKTCIVRLNEEMEIIYANAEFASLLQSDPLELIGTYIPNIIAPKYREASLNRFIEFKEGSTSYYHEDAEIYRKDGKTVWVEVLVSGIRKADGSLASITATLNDITKRKQKESELKNQLVQIKKVKSNMDKFYSIIGHDLKTTLITTKLISDNLLPHVEKQNDSKTAKYLKDITCLAENGLDLLDNLVSWTKSVIEGFDYQPTYFNLRRLCAEIEKHFTILSQIKGIMLVNSVNEDITIFADRNMIKTVIRNLVSNAIKYSHTGGAVTIDSKTENEKIVITVSDRGIGIACDALPHLFDIKPKRQTDSTNSNAGNGIGLLICKHFVERHEGYIAVESTLGSGTSVMVELKK